jgi:hypothetical protein
MKSRLARKQPQQPTGLLARVRAPLEKQVEDLDGRLIDALRGQDELCTLIEFAYEVGKLPHYPLRQECFDLVMSAAARWCGKMPPEPFKRRK